MATRTLEVEQIFGPKNTAAEHIASLWQDNYASMQEERTLRQEIDTFLEATDTKKTTNAKNPFANTTHRPKLTQLKDSLIANYKEGIMPGQHWMRFEGEDEDSVAEGKQRAVESYLEAKHRQYDFEEVVDDWLNDWVGSPGTCFGGVQYVNEVYTSNLGERVTAYTGPKAFRIHPNDIVFDLTAKSFDDSWKIVRTIKSIGDLHRDIEERPELGYQEEILFHVKDVRDKLNSWSLEEVDKYVSLGDTGFGSVSNYFRSGYVELLEFFGDLYDPETGEYHKGQVITVVDRKFIIRQQPVDTWNGRPHIYMATWRKRSNNLMGMSPLANLVGLQFRVNHLENTRADAFDKIANPDRVEIGLVESDYDEDGTRTWYAPDGGDVRFLHPPTAALNADLQIAELERSMEEYVGAPSETSMGIRSPGEKTKFEVQSLESRASRIFQSKLASFERFLKDIINAEIEVARRNLDTADLIKIEDDDLGVAEFRQIAKADITANGTLIPTGSRTFARKARLIQEMRTFIEMLGADPEIRQHFPSTKMAKVMEDLMDFEQFALFEPFGRINESADSRRTQAAVNDQMIEEEAAMRTLDDIS